MQEIKLPKINKLSLQKRVDHFIDKYIILPTGNPRKNVQIRRYKDGSYYQGTILNGKRHGKGIYTYKNLDMYLGDWENDFFNGRGIYLFHNGDFYFGDLRDG